MTYGSQAAAATHVFEQQRDLALRDRERAAPRGRRRRPRPARRRDVRPVRVVRQADRRRSGSRRCRRPPLCIDCQRRPAAGERRRRSGAENQREPVDDPSTTDRRRARRRSTTIRAAAATLAGIALRTPLVPFGPPRIATSGSRPSPCSRSARSRSAARTSQSPRSSPERTRARPDHLLVGATTRRASRGRLACSASRRRS